MVRIIHEIFALPSRTLQHDAIFMDGVYSPPPPPLLMGIHDVTGCSACISRHVPVPLYVLWTVHMVLSMTSMYIYISPWVLHFLSSAAPPPLHVRPRYISVYGV